MDEVETATDSMDGRSAKVDDLFTTDTAGLSEASPSAGHPAPRRRPVRPRIEPVRKRIDDAELRMLGYNGSIPGPDLARRSGVGDHRAGDQRRRRRGDRPLARPSAGEPLRRRPARDAGADPDRRDVHLQGPVPRRRVLLVPPAHPRGLRPGDGPVRHDRRRARRPVVLARRRPPAEHHAGRPARRGRPHRALPPLRAQLHRDGPVRQRHADQRRDRSSPARRPWERSCASIS